MALLRKLFAPALAVLVCLPALLLPYAARCAWARLHSTLGDADRFVASRAMRANVSVWNRLLLGLTFWFAFPLTKLLFALFGKRMLAPPSGRPSYWVPRPPPEVVAEDADQPF